MQDTMHKKRRPSVQCPHTAARKDGEKSDRRCPMVVDIVARLQVRTETTVPNQQAETLSLVSHKLGTEEVGCYGPLLCSGVIWLYLQMQNDIHVGRDWICRTSR